MRSCTIPSFIQPSESFDSPDSPVPASGAPLSVLIHAGTPYSRMAASQICYRHLMNCFRLTVIREQHGNAKVVIGDHFRHADLSETHRRLQLPEMLT
jgi:hypothetical protein